MNSHSAENIGLLFIDLRRQYPISFTVGSNEAESGRKSQNVTLPPPLSEGMLFFGIITLKSHFQCKLFEGNR